MLKTTSGTLTSEIPSEPKKKGRDYMIITFYSVLSLDFQ